jgi:galactonate dehydratase
MKIRQIDIYLARSGKLRPIVVELITDEGVTGIGEAGVAYGCGSHAATGMLKDLAPALLGWDASRIEAFSTYVYDHTFWGKGGGTIVYAALSAIEQALWDIKGKVCGAPVYELLGGAARDRVRCYANGWYEAAQTARPIRTGDRAAATRRLYGIEVLSARRNGRRRHAPRQPAHGRPRSAEPGRRPGQGRA